MTISLGDFLEMFSRLFGRKEKRFSEKSFCFFKKSFEKVYKYSKKSIEKVLYTGYNMGIYFFKGDLLCLKEK